MSLNNEMEKNAEIKKIAVINASAPYGNNAGKDALDLALIFGSYEQAISLFFHNDGVWQLINGQQPQVIQQKDYLKTFSAFDLYDIQHVYVAQESLDERGLSVNFHIPNVTVLTQQAFNDELAKHQTIFRF